MSTSGNNSQLLGVGKQCSHPSCNLVDFLPFKCHHCEDHFCQEHFKVTAHNCPKYDESKHNRIAPNCPLCNIPVAVRPGQDANMRMDEHIDKECSVTTGKEGKARTMPVCARPSCKKVLFSPIRCDKCREQFCPSHRFPSDHNCSPRSTPPARPGLSHLFNNANAKNVSSTASATATATFNALKKSVAPATVVSAPMSKAPTPAPKPTAPVATSKLTTSSSHSNPFSKTDSPFPLSPPIFLHDTNPSSPNSNDAHHDHAVPIIPKPTLFNPNSFVPRSIFATA